MDSWESGLLSSNHPCWGGAYSYWQRPYLYIRAWNVGGKVGWIPNPSWSWNRQRATDGRYRPGPGKYDYSRLHLLIQRFL